MREDRSLESFETGRTGEVSRFLIEKMYLNLTENTLPGIANENGWVVTEDHCFHRIILDNVLGNVWYEELERNGFKPAYQQLGRENLLEAIHLSVKIIMEGDSEVEKLNERSLGYREKKNNRL